MSKGEEQPSAQAASMNGLQWLLLVQNGLSAQTAKAIRDFTKENFSLKVICGFVVAKMIYFMLQQMVSYAESVAFYRSFK